jgi:hypothetical protein
MVMPALSGEHPRGGMVEYYVVAYEALAVAASMDPQRLWRAPWTSPAGQVSPDLPAIIAELHQHTGMALDST